MQNAQICTSIHVQAEFASELCNTCSTRPVLARRIQEGYNGVSDKMHLTGGGDNVRGSVDPNWGQVRLSQCPTSQKQTALLCLDLWHPALLDASSLHPSVRTLWRRHSWWSQWLYCEHQRYYRSGICFLDFGAWQKILFRKLCCALPDQQLFQGNSVLKFSEHRPSSTNRGIALGELFSAKPVGKNSEGVNPVIMSGAMVIGSLRSL